MNCPICNVSLLMAERQGIEIDYCPQCRGVWLDRGKLDKIIERSASSSSSSVGMSENRYRREDHRYEDHDRHHDDHHEHYKKKKHSIFDLFD